MRPLVILVGLVALWVGAWMALSRRADPPPSPDPPKPRMDARCHICPHWGGGPRSESAYCDVTRKHEERFEWCERHPVLVQAAATRKARAAERGSE